MDLMISLDKIIELIEQVNGITINQGTIILGDSFSEENQQQLDQVLEEMVKNKEVLIEEIERIEVEFEKEYNLRRANLTNKAYVDQLKQKVAKVLEIKKNILENEKNNMLMMQSKIRQQNKIIEIPKDPKKVIETYKSNSGKTHR